ncbi:MAG TPA: hypothetical protein VGZ22_01885 [Isosphaeraceae bacterium]|jgi:hypothetical protein|nr:hypothetical protein [Isosphaeraceae bacterium]
MRLQWRWRIRTLMLLVAIAAAVFYADLLRRRRAYFLDRASYYAAHAKSTQAELARAKDRLAWAEQMRGRGYVSQGQVVTERVSLESAEFWAQNAASDRLRHSYEYAASHPWINAPTEAPGGPN